MFLHDFIYSMYKKAPKVFLQALKDGFGVLPKSLQPPLRCSNADFVRKVDEVGSCFSLSNLKKRLCGRLGEG